MEFFPKVGWLLLLFCHKMKASLFASFSQQNVFSSLYKFCLLSDFIMKTLWTQIKLIFSFRPCFFAGKKLENKVEESPSFFLSNLTMQQEEEPTKFSFASTETWLLPYKDYTLLLLYFIVHTLHSS